MNAEKILTIVTRTLLVKTQMDPLCAPVYLDLTEMDGTAEVKALREDVNILRTNLKYFGSHPKFVFCPTACFLARYVLIIVV